MAQNMAEPCRNCGAALNVGAAFCTICGGAVSNRAASPTPSSVPLGGPSANPFATGGNPHAPGPGAPSSSGGAPEFGAPGSQTLPAQRLPGIVNVSTATGDPLLPPVQVGVDPRAAEATALANGGAGRRLAAKIIDGVPPAILLGAGAGIGSALISTSAVTGGTQLNLTWLIVLLSVASVLSIAYVVWQWMWEAKTGKTLGNVMLGLRTTDMAGHPAGLLAIFLRSLMVSLSSVVPTAGPIVMLISNIWDKNGKKQGWHDKVAHTLVFNVSKGRNPLETGGIGDRENFSPAPVATISQVQSPLARPADRPAAPSSPYTSAPASAPTSGQGVAPGAGQQFAGQFPGAPETAAPAPAPATRAGRRNKKKGLAVDPFAPPVIQFQNQQGQQFAGQQGQSQFQNPNQTPGQFQAPQGPGQQNPNPQAHGQLQTPSQTPGQFQAPQAVGQQNANPQAQGQFQNPQGPGQQFNPFAPPPSAPAGQLPVDQGPITNVPGITRPPVAPGPEEQQFHQQNVQQEPAAQQADQFRQGEQSQPSQPFSPQAQQAQSAHPVSANPWAQTPATAAPDDEAGETRARPQGARTALRLSFDDGRTEELGSTALVGRNPAGYDGEMISRLIPIQDSTRSVSKTHIHLSVSSEGLWVTDRNSTNGSAISSSNGAKIPLVGGTPALARPGSRVHFGDRSFLVENV